MFVDDNTISNKIGKYQNALSNLCGCDYPYMQGDPDVDAITELISIFVQQTQDIEVLNDEIKALKEEHPKYNIHAHEDSVVRCKNCKWYGTVDCAMDDIYSVSNNDYCSRGEAK